jgi:hypothetical protein
MSQQKRDYDSTVARIAGNILSGMVDRILPDDRPKAVSLSVQLAREIVAEVRATAGAEETR